MKDSNNPNTTHKQLLRSALFYLKFRFRTEYEMRSYLHKKVDNASLEQINHIISELRSDNLINDDRFAHEWISSQLKKGKGAYYINKQLTKLGIDPKIIHQALKNVDETAQVNAAKAIIHKKKRLFNQLNYMKKKLKIKQYLFNNGFSPHIILKAIDDLLMQGVE